MHKIPQLPSVLVSRRKEATLLPLLVKSMHAFPSVGCTVYYPCGVKPCRTARIHTRNFSAESLASISSATSRGTLGGGILRSEGSTFQISRAYSLMVLSLENFPEAAMFLMTSLVHSLVFCKKELMWTWLLHDNQTWYSHLHGTEHGPALHDTL